MSKTHLPAGDWRIAVYGRSQITGCVDRRKPTKTTQERVIAQQGYKCLYCEIPLGTKIRRHRKELILKAHWDHFVPYAYSQQNPSDNWVLSCHVCNLIKTARMFDTVEAARAVILPARIAKGYESPDDVFHRLGLERTRGVVIVTAPRPTDRQLEALQLYARGAGLTSIAETFEISHTSVRKLLEKAARRLGAATREEAVDIAHRNGYIRLRHPESEAS